MKTKNKTPADVETVTITMSRKTAEAVKQACEEYLRLRMGQFEDFTNEVCCWDYAEQMEKECHTTEERKKFHRDHEQDFYKCMRLRDRMRAGLRALWAQNVPTASIQFTLKEAYRAESVWLAMNSVRERMTRDWEEVTDDHGRKRDLCPECSKEYKKIIGGFLKKK